MSKKGYKEGGKVSKEVKFRNKKSKDIFKKSKGKGKK